MLDAILSGSAVRMIFSIKNYQYKFKASERQITIQLVFFLKSLTMHCEANRTNYGKWF